MGRRRLLIDSNVLIAAATDDHIHQEPSLALLNSAPDATFATSIHCLSECYNGITRVHSSGGAALAPEQAMSAIAPYTASIEVLTMMIPEHLRALQCFSDLGGVGPRVYDFLIGYVAEIYRIPIIVTWNTRHFVPLFPSLRILTPAQYLETV